MNSLRKLIIYRKHRTRRWDYTTVPEIRLEGKWLADLGFTEGSQVQIQPEQNKLTITLFKEGE